MNRRGSIALYRRLLGHLRPHWRAFTLAVLAMLMAAAQPAIPIILKPELDETFAEQDPNAVGRLTVMLVIAVVVWGFANWARTAAFAIICRRVLFDLHQCMFDKLLALPIGRPDRLSVPRLMSKFTFDADRIGEAADRTLAVLVTDVLAVIGLLTWNVWIDCQPTLLMLLAVPLVALTVRYFNRRLCRVSHLVQNLMAAVNRLLREAFDAERAVRVFGIIDEAAEPGVRQTRRRLARGDPGGGRSRVPCLAVRQSTTPVAQSNFALTRSRVIHNISPCFFAVFAAIPMASQIDGIETNRSTRQVPSSYQDQTETSPSHQPGQAWS